MSAPHAAELQALSLWKHRIESLTTFSAGRATRGGPHSGYRSSAGGYPNSAGPTPSVGHRLSPTAWAALVTGAPSATADSVEVLRSLQRGSPCARVCSRAGRTPRLDWPLTARPGLRRLRGRWYGRVPARRVDYSRDVRARCSKLTTRRSLRRSVEFLRKSRAPACWANNCRNTPSGRRNRWMRRPEPRGVGGLSAIAVPRNATERGCWNGIDRLLFGVLSVWMPDSALVRSE